MVVQEKIKKLRIRTKLIIGFMLIIILSTGLGLMVFLNLKKISNISHSLSNPNERLIRLNHILKDISEAESTLRTYSLTRDENLLSSYFRNIYLINSKVDTLKQLSGNEDQKESIEKVAKLLNQKIKLLDELITLKSQDKTSSFYDQAIDRLSEASADSSLLKKEIRTTISKSDPADSNNIYNEEPPFAEEDNVKFWGRVKRFFSKKEKIKEKPVEPKSPELITTTDTTIIFFAETDSLIGNVKKILTDVKSQADEQSKILSRQETELLIKDKNIMDKIRNIIVQMEQEEQVAATKYASTSSRIVEQTTQIIFWFIMGAMIILIVTTWLISRDVTRSNYIRERLENEKDKAQELVKARELFLANMSHEIRTPLGAIIGFSEQLQQTEGLNPKQRSFSNALVKASTHLLHTVNEILDFSKIEAGKIAIEEMPFNLKSIVLEVYQTLKINADEKKIGFKYLLKGNTDIMLISDAFRIKQVLINLVNNAVKFTDEGYVRLVCEILEESQENCKVQFLIEDTGIGISKENQDHIFEEFTQADYSTTRKYGGTGLGLTISRKITKLLGGEIKLSSQMGKGTVFTVLFTFPKTQLPSQATIRETSPLRTMSLRGKRILVVDDEELNRILLQTIFEKWDAKPVLASSGAQALEHLKNSNFDIVITDIQMPLMSGYDLTQQIRNHDNPSVSALPVLALTANILKQEAHKMKDCGMDDYLLKPFDEKSLVEKTISLLNPCGLPLEDKENEQENVNQIKPESQTENQLFKLDRLLQFTSENHDAMVLVLKTFISDTNNNITQLEELKTKGDYKGLANLAHKMLNMFRMLSIQAAIPHLEKLESFREQAIDEQIAIVCINQIKQVSKGVVQDITNELNAHIANSNNNAPEV